MESYFAEWHRETEKLFQKPKPYKKYLLGGLCAGLIATAAVTYNLDNIKERLEKPSYILGDN